MKRTLFAFFCLLSTALFAQHSLTVDVKGLRNTKGTLYFSVFRTETGFPDKPDNAFRKGKVEALKGAAASYLFANLPAGTYAVSLFHDEDNNGSLKTNALGIPLEGSAASNDARGKFGPPKFADAKFTLGADKKITITMWYF